MDSELGRVTALVNNAGTVGHKSRVEEMSEFRILKTLKTNVLAPILCAKHALLRMSPKHGGQGGSIVNVSSVASRLGSPNEYVDYAASKGALDSFTIGLAKEVAGEGIRVNAVRPGYIYTDFHALSGDPDRVSKLESAIPMARGGRPDEVAEAIVWLLSDKASYATGTFVDLGGGRIRSDRGPRSTQACRLARHDRRPRPREEAPPTLAREAGYPHLRSLLQNDLTIRPNVSIAFSAASSHGLP